MALVLAALLAVDLASLFLPQVSSARALPTPTKDAGVVRGLVVVVALVILVINLAKCLLLTLELFFLLDVSLIKSLLLLDISLDISSVKSFLQAPILSRLRRSSILLVSLHLLLTLPLWLLHWALKLRSQSFQGTELLMALSLVAVPTLARLLLDVALIMFLPLELVTSVLSMAQLSALASVLSKAQLLALALAQLAGPTLQDLITVELPSLAPIKAPTAATRL